MEDLRNGRMAFKSERNRSKSIHHKCIIIALSALSTKESNGTVTWKVCFPVHMSGKQMVWMEIRRNALEYIFASNVREQNSSKLQTTRHENHCSSKECHKSNRIFNIVISLVEQDVERHF